MNSLQRNLEIRAGREKNVARHREELEWIPTHTPIGMLPDFKRLAVLRQKFCYRPSYGVVDIELKLRRTWARREYWDGDQTDKKYSQRCAKAA